MNTYNFNDKEFQQTESYQNYIKENPTFGTLRIRANAANGAIPIEGLKIIVKKTIDNYNIIFFEGYTNSSGIIENIKLPAPTLNSNNLAIPNRTTYDINATYIPENLNLNYKINIYENVFVVQNISIVPSLMVSSEIETGDISWL